MMDINFKGAFFTLQRFIPLLGRGSSVTVLSSVNAYTGAPNTSVYGASKAALNSLTRAAAIELASKGIRVNAVCPGPVDTELVVKAGIPPSSMEQFNAALTQRVPLKRLAKPAEIGKLVAFLSSEDAAFITGAEYLIDGGIGINPILG
jgi:NAD(P)-dependent dehydrogenase (short-subunit alcohol dehydrogenase family)